MKKQLIALGVLGIAVSSAFAFQLLSPARKWFTSDLPVTFRVNANGEESVNDADHGVTACRNAIAAWDAEVPGSLVTTTTTSSNAVGNDGQNVVSFNDPARIVRNAIAVTLVGFYNSGQTEVVNGITFRRYLDSDTSFSSRLNFTTQAIGAVARRRVHRHAARHVGEPIAQLEDDALGRLLADPRNAGQTRDVAALDGAQHLPRIHAGENGDRQLRADSADADQPLEQLPLELRQKPVQLQCVLADVGVDAQRDLGAYIAGVVERREWHVHFIADTLNVDDERIGLLVCDTAAEKSDHPWAGGRYCRHDLTPVGRTLPGSPGRM